MKQFSYFLIFKESSMRLLGLRLPVLIAVALAAFSVGVTLVARQTESVSASEAGSSACPSDDSGLTLPPGFCATIFADGIGHARHMAVTATGVVYVNTWSGQYYGNDKPHDGGFLVALQATSGKDPGKADVQERFGETVQS